MNYKDIEDKYFIPETDQFSLYKNYEAGLKNFYYYSLLLYDLSEKICDGIIVDEDESISIMNLFNFFKEKTIKYKRMLGSERDITDPYVTHSLNEINFEISNIDGDMDILSNYAIANLRSFSRVFDFQLYEISQLAIAIITRLYAMDEIF